jgi:hypothetical protein
MMSKGAKKWRRAKCLGYGLAVGLIFVVAYLVTWIRRRLVRFGALAGGLKQVIQ